MSSVNELLNELVHEFDLLVIRSESSHQESSGVACHHASRISCLLGRSVYVMYIESAASVQLTHAFSDFSPPSLACFLVGHPLGAERHFEADVAHDTKLIVAHGVGEDRHATLVQPRHFNAEGQRTDQASLTHRIEGGASAGRVTGSKEDEGVGGVEARSVDGDGRGHTLDNGTRGDGKVGRRGRWRGR